MPAPVRITFRHLSPSPALEARIHECVRHLEHFHARITACRVVVAAPAGHSNKGTPFRIRIDLSVPGRKFCVDTQRTENTAHTNAHVAVHAAFDTLRRQLQSYDQQHLDARRRAGQISESAAAE